MAEPYRQSKWINILADATAVNGVPTLATQGIDLKREGEHRGKLAPISFRTTAAGTRTFIAKLWGYMPGEWSAATPQVFSAASARWDDLGETITLDSTNGASDKSFSAIYRILSCYDRVYVQITELTGSPTINFALGLTEAI
jgi:hypothetical protein